MGCKDGQPYNTKKALQQQSAYFVKNGWGQTPGAVPNLLNDLDWPSLQHGRKNINFFILPFYQYKWQPGNEVEQMILQWLQ